MWNCTRFLKVSAFEDSIVLKGNKNALIDCKNNPKMLFLKNKYDIDLSKYEILDLRE
jgi:hypothetical protein